MNKFTKWMAGTFATILVATGLAIMPVMVADAHTPTITASCNGVVLKATAYDPKKANTWTTTVGNSTSSGTFGASLTQTIPVPQEASTTSWSATIQAEDGSYASTKGGTLGPCGTTTVNLPTLGSTPGTCSTPGTLWPDFTLWPAAQNPNGYEGDGYRVYINPAFTGAGTYTATLQKVGPGFDPKYPNGTKVVGQTSQTIVVEPQISDEVCAGPQPENKVVTSEWLDTEVTCEDDFVSQSRTITTTGYIREGQVWIEGESSVVTEYGTRDKTAEEIEDCVVVVPPVEPPVVDPPVTTPPVVDIPKADPPVTTQVTDVLARTGSNGTLFLQIFIGGLVGLGAGILALLIARAISRR